MLARRPLEATMSRYLVERIAAQPNIEVVGQAEVTALEGDGGVLQAIRWRDAAGRETRKEIGHLFLFIGADPNTDWLAASGLRRCPKGFIATTGEAGLDSSSPGVFAIGDVRAGSIKRVASAVGEGAQAVARLHAWLADHDERQLATGTG